MLSRRCSRPSRSQPESTNHPETRSNDLVVGNDSVVRHAFTTRESRFPVFARDFVADSIRFDSIRFDSARLGSARLELSRVEKHGRRGVSAGRCLYTYYSSRALDQRTNTVSPRRPILDPDACMHARTLARSFARKRHTNVYSRCFSLCHAHRLASSLDQPPA